MWEYKGVTVTNHECIEDLARELFLEGWIQCSTLQSINTYEKIVYFKRFILIIKTSIV